MTYCLSMYFMNGAVARVLLLFDQPSYVFSIDNHLLSNIYSSLIKKISDVPFHLQRPSAAIGSLSALSRTENQNKQKNEKIALPKVKTILSYPGAINYVKLHSS